MARCSSRLPTRSSNDELVLVDAIEKRSGPLRRVPIPSPIVNIAQGGRTAARVMEHWRKSLSHQQSIFSSPLVLLSGIGGGTELEPRGCSPEWTVAGKLRNRRQITAPNIWGLVHPRWIVLNALPHLRPAACEVSCLRLPWSRCGQPPTFD